MSTLNQNDLNGGSIVRNELDEINIQTNHVQDQVSLFDYNYTEKWMVVWLTITLLIETCCCRKRDCHYLWTKQQKNR